MSRAAGGGLLATRKQGNGGIDKSASCAGPAAGHADVATSMCMCTDVHEVHDDAHCSAAACALLLIHTEVI